MAEPLSSFLKGIIVDARNYSDDRGIDRIRIVLYCQETETLAKIVLKSKLAKAWEKEMPEVIKKRTKFYFEGILVNYLGEIVTVATKMAVLLSAPVKQAATRIVHETDQVFASSVP
ncbi:MAG: hypothetical protein PHE24_03245 [Patescibacteria group bacterium]|nr:hypothetical protein [Patescibacteria group bacterium]